MADIPGLIVLGFPRSGTTLLRRILDAHPAISCPPETGLVAACGRFLREDRTAEGLPIGVLAGLGFLGVPEADVLGALRKLVTGFHGRIAAEAGKRVWIEKTGVDIFYLDQIEALFGGHARFLCITRHPLDVILSVRDLVEGMDQILAELHPFVRTRQSLLQAFADAWIDRAVALDAFVARRAADCLRLRYEDLLADPAGVTAALTDFVGVERAPAGMLDALFSGGARVGLGDWKTYESRGFDGTRRERWRRELPPAALARLVPRLAPHMERMGYAVPKAPREPGRAEAVRRYQMAKMVKQMAGQEAGK